MSVFSKSRYFLRADGFGCASTASRSDHHHQSNARAAKGRRWTTGAAPPHRHPDRIKSEKPRPASTTIAGTDHPDGEHMASQNPATGFSRTVLRLPACQKVWAPPPRGKRAGPRVAASIQTLSIACRRAAYRRAATPLSPGACGAGPRAKAGWPTGCAAPPGRWISEPASVVIPVAQSSRLAGGVRQLTTSCF
jgi:hypothetical protein